LNHKKLVFTDGLNGSGVEEVIGNDLTEFGEMPAVPFSQSHHVVVDFLIQIIKEGDSLKKSLEKEISVGSLLE